MPKKTAQTKKPQLRRCGVCNKAGHNKSTCPEYIQTQPKKTANQPLRFFVHHVSYDSASSPHVIDLKNNDSHPWRNVQSSAPEETQNKNYYYHHQTLSNTADSEKLLPGIKNDFGPSFVPAKVKKKESKPSLKPARKPLSLLASNVKNSVYRAKKKIFNRTAQFSKYFLTPRRIITAALLVTIIFLAPSSAQTYYTDVKSTANQIASNSTAGFINLKDSTTALMSGDINGAQQTITGALQNFDEAVNTLENKHRLLQTIISVLPIIGNQVQSRQNLVLAGQDISFGNAQLLKGLSEIKNQASSTLTDNMRILGGYLDNSIPSYQKAQNELSGTDPGVLPNDYQQTFKEFRVLFTAFVDDLKNISNLNQSIQDIFGGQGLRRYLLVFQNPYEIRPTGGFMGSFAVADIEDGKLIKMDIPAGGSYDLDGQLNENVEPPAPLLLSNKRWEFQDANWFPDFPQSAQKIAWFYRHSRKNTVDGVIAINATVLGRILEITGPITDPSRNLTITKDNALATIQDIVENGPEKKDDKPKQIISDLASVFISDLKDIKPQDVLQILLSLQDALQKKEVQAYFTDVQSENAMKQFGWAGSILNTNPNQDYLMVVNTNIQGQKSDARINQTISHQAMVEDDGSVIDTVTVTRQHTGQEAEDLYGVPNIDYIRVYAPQGSRLISASGFRWPDDSKFKTPENWYTKDATLSEVEKEISIDNQTGTRTTDEFGKTAFANWMITEPGQTSEAQFVYKLPFKVFSQNAADSSLDKWSEMFSSGAPVSQYQLAVQKQSGVDSDFESQILYPDGWHSVWQDGANSTMASNGIAIAKFKLDKDGVWSLLMSQDK